MRVILMTGPAAERDDPMLEALIIEHGARLLGPDMGIVIEPGGTVELGIGAVELKEIDYATRGRSEVARSFFASGSEDRPQINGQGLSAIAPTSRGRTAMLCVQEGSLDEDDCLIRFDDLTQLDLGELGAPKDQRVTVAGVAIRHGDGCNYNQPQNIVCFLEGTLDWLRGSPQEARQRVDRWVRLYTDDNGIEGYHNPMEVYECELSGRSSTCYEIAQQGVLDHPHRILYAAVVDLEDASYAVSCNVSVDEEMNDPCQRVFGGNTTGRWHR